MLVLTNEIASVSEMTEIVAEYYDFYRKQISAPFLYEEVVGNEEKHSETLCCALPIDVFNQIVSLLSVDSKALTSFVNENQCKNQKKIIWKRSYRLGYEEAKYKPSAHENIDICKFLIISVFTDEYCRNPNSFSKLFSIFQYGLGKGQHDFDQDEIKEFIDHLHGNIGKNVNYEWAHIFDETYIMYMQYYNDTKRYYGFLFKEVWNKKTEKNKTEYEI